jgi:hypothetical protein
MEQTLTDTIRDDADTLLIDMNADRANLGRTEVLQLAICLLNSYLGPEAAEPLYGAHWVVNAFTVQGHRFDVTTDDQMYTQG